MVTPKVFATARQDDVLVIKLLGEVSGLDWQNVHRELEDAARQLCSDGPRDVVIDFNQSSYFDSSMLNAILHLTRRVRDCHGRLAMCNVSASGRQILELVKFDSLWPICETRASALEMLAGRSDCGIS